MTLKITPAKETGTDAAAHETPALIDAVTARRKATGYAAGYIGGLLLGRDPVLIAGDAPVWRVKIMLTFPDMGIVGEVGTLDVDAYTGKVLVTEAQAKTIERTALELAQRTPPAARP